MINSTFLRDKFTDFFQANIYRNYNGGEGRIRTYVAEAADLQSAGINHSPTSPFQGRYFCSRMSLSQLVYEIEYT